MSTKPRVLFVLALAGTVSSAPSLSATLSDLIEDARVAGLFVSAGIPAKSYWEPSKKMMPTLVEGDVFLVDLRQAGLQPERGELIVSWYDPKTVYIDRVIGLPGDRIALRAGHIVLNGAEIAQQPAGSLDACSSVAEVKTCDVFVETLPGARPYRIARMTSGGGFYDDVPETIVASGHLYLLGDNRDNSVDSRVESRGQVTIESVIGRIVYRMRPNAGWLVPRETVPGLAKE